MKAESKDIQSLDWKQVPEDRLKLYGIDGMWTAKDSEYIRTIQLMSEANTCFGRVTHIVITKMTDIQYLMKITRGATAGYEPTYIEKVQTIQKSIRRKNTVAMEIFPRQSDVVDELDMYHIWVAKKAKFPFGILETTEIPENKEWESEKVDGLDIEYIVKTTKTKFGKVAYFYIRRKDGKELRWVEKQQIKNKLQSEEMTAIEIISAKGIGKPTCLMYLPLGYSLDFGLHC